MDEQRLSIQARIEQEEAARGDALKAFAGSLGSYFAALLASGFSEPQAMVIVIEYHAMFWQRGFGFVQSCSGPE